MAESQGVWGIEIGQSALKAVRLRYAEAAGQCIAVAFDYVPHPKILSQPDAVPEELINQALATFLSRNEVQGDRIAISVPGQPALARFIKLPPVEAGKVDEIVKYEARQQIPFDLNDVIWDYQNLGGGSEESGFMLEAEVGLFAMKREQVMGYLKPFTDAKVEVDLIQIAPLALYNFLSYDHLGMRRGEEFTASNEHHILIDMGADNTTLLVSNGAKIWLRNMPIGGNHFTRALAKEMKLTFAKAEHLKCNATKSPDPRAVFQALRPVFNNFVSEIQKSVGFFSSVNREAKIKKVLGMGNGFKLAGLQKFLQQHLQYPVEKVDRFQAAVGDNVLGAPLFQENILGFVVPYGLALQELQVTELHTTLLPPEIATARTIRRKKPWAVASAATLLLALGVSAAGAGNVWRSASKDRWQQESQQATTLGSTVSSNKTSYENAKSTYQTIALREDSLLRGADHRDDWLELFAAINASLPRDPNNEAALKDPTLRKELNIRAVTTRKYDDLSVWYQQFGTGTGFFMRPDDLRNPLEGPGQVVRIEGSYYLPDPRFANGTLLENLKQWTVKVEPSGETYPMRLLGVTHAALIDHISEQVLIRDPDAKPQSLPQNNIQRGPREFGSGGEGGPGITIPGRGSGRGELTAEPMKEIVKNVFIIEFAWRPTSERQMAVFDALRARMQNTSPAATTPDMPFPDAQQQTEAILTGNAPLPSSGSKLPPYLCHPLTQKEYDEYLDRFVPKPSETNPAGTPPGTPGSPPGGAPPR